MASIDSDVEVKPELVLLEVKRELDVQDDEHFPESKPAADVKMEPTSSDSEYEDPEDEEDDSSSYSSEGERPNPGTMVKVEMEKLVCDDCGKTYSSKGYLERHRKVCKNPDQIPCHLCTKVFGSAQELRYHLNEHTGERPYVCRQTETCGQAFFHPRYRVIHEQECGGGAANQDPVEPDEVYIDGVKRFVCGKCGKANKTPGLFRRHKRHCHGTKNCHLCSMVFKDAFELKYHLNLHSGETPFQCQKNCNESFHSPRHRRRHEKMCGPPESHRPDEGDQWKTYVCDICGKRYANMGYLMRHKRFYHNPNPQGTMACHICLVEFKNSTRLRYHLYEHNGEKPFPCRMEGCGEAFCNPTRRHEHEGACGKAGKIRCEECNLPLSPTKPLRTHKLTHKEHRHVCTVCGDKFHHKYLLKKHMEKHRADTNMPVVASGSVDPHTEPSQVVEPPGKEEQISTPKRTIHSVTQRVPCPQCKRSFTSIGRLKFHRERCMKLCSYCPASFRSKQELNYHMNKHTGETPFKCRLEPCDKSFHDPRIRLEHEKECKKVKGGGDPADEGETAKKAIKFTCEHCGKKYANMGFALRHKRLCNNVTAKEHFQCHLCPKQFLQSVKLRFHLNEHTGETPYPCRGENCDAAFTDPQKRRRHEEQQCFFQNAATDEISIEANAVIKDEPADVEASEEIVGI